MTLTATTKTDLERQVKDANRELQRRAAEEQERRIAAATARPDPERFAGEHSQADEDGVPQPPFQLDPVTKLFHDGAMIKGPPMRETCVEPPRRDREWCELQVRYWSNAATVAAAEFTRIKELVTAYASAEGRAPRPVWNAKVFGPAPETRGSCVEYLGRMKMIVDGRRATLREARETLQQLPEVVAAEKAAAKAAAEKNRREQAAAAEQAAFWGGVTEQLEAINI